MAESIHKWIGDSLVFLFLHSPTMPGLWHSCGNYSFCFVGDLLDNLSKTKLNQEEFIHVVYCSCQVWKGEVRS